MNQKTFYRYWFFVCLGLLLASFYPLLMGVRVVGDMLLEGTVLKENYPKYIIPYTPIALGLLAGVALLPVFRKLGRLSLAGGTAVAVAVFFAAELLFERNVVVTAEETVAVLEDWQMFMCYQPPGGWGETVTTYRELSPVEILMGEYTPAFKLHFYGISLVLILSILNCIYGFAQGHRERTQALVLQSIAAAAFLGLCILACFTAFWRDGSLQVSALSAGLMTAFFLLFGLVGGIWLGSFLLGRTLSLWLPALTASLLTALMYIGELILLNGHLYIYGKGWFFRGLSGIVLAPVDLLIILGSGLLTALVFWRISGKKLANS